MKHATGRPARLAVGAAALAVLASTVLAVDGSASPITIGEAVSASAPNIPPPPPTSGTVFAGSIVNAAGGGNTALDQAASAGLRWIREDVFWPAVEPIRGKAKWHPYDSLFLSAARRGIRILPIVDQVPSWVAANKWTIPSDPTEFAAFTAKVAARYGPGGTLWQQNPALAGYAPVYFEIWNEPWWKLFSSTGVDPARYARLFRAAAAAGRAANAEARFIVTADWQYRAADGSWRNWVDDLYAAVPDLNTSADAYSVHPYGNGSVDSWTPGSGEAFQTRRLEIVHDTFAAHGAADKKMWVTEVGWSTCSDGSDACFTEAQQAANLARFDQLTRTSWTYIQAVFYYRLADYGPADPLNREYWFGVIRRDGTYKPAWNALQAALTG